MNQMILFYVDVSVKDQKQYSMEHFLNTLNNDFNFDFIFF